MFNSLKICQQKNYKSAILEDAVDNLEYVLETYRDLSIHPDDYDLKAGILHHEEGIDKQAYRRILSRYPFPE